MIDILGLIMFLFVISLSFVVLNLVKEGGVTQLKKFGNPTSETSVGTEQLKTNLEEIPSRTTGESVTLFDTIEDLLTFDLTKSHIWGVIFFYIVLLVVIHLVFRKDRYMRLWKEHKDKKKQELLKKENSGYNAYLVSIQISEKLDFLVTSDGKPRMFYNTDRKFYKNNKTFEQIQKMLEEIQAVYITYKKENNLKMNRYETNLNTVLQTIEKSGKVSLLDSHKVLEGILGTINSIHCDIVGSLEDNITKDLRRD